MLYIQTVPDLRLHLGGAPVAGLVNTKGGAIAAYLALTGGAAPRAQIAGLLWSDMDEVDALNNLRFTLSRLRHQLPGIIEATRQEIRLSKAFPRRVDVDALRTGDPAEIVDLRVEDFLANLHPPNAEAFREWVAGMREDLGAQYLARVTEVAETLRGAGEVERAVRAYRRCLALAPWSEKFHRALAMLHADQGDGAGALAQLAACKEALRRELSVEPEPDTTSLETEIRARRLQRSPPSSSPSPSPSSAEAPAAAGPGGQHVGREAELARLRELVLSPAARIVTVLGPGGAGKTHLARIVVQELAGRFASGMAVVRLDDVAPQRAGRGAAILLARLAEALGVSLVPGRELPVLAEALREREQIVLVDNFESIGDAWTALGALSEQAPGLTFVVTSRHQVGLPVEWVVRLSGLDWPRGQAWRPEHGEAAAVRLFIGTAGRLGHPPDLPREGDAVLRICAALEGWPLGLILAASWLQVHGCEEIAARLERGAGILADPVPGGLAPRHRSATAVLDQSWALMDEAERAALPALCVFAGRFDAAEAAAVAGAGAGVLAALVGKSLVRREAGGALSLHPLLREYGLRRLGEDPARQDTVLAAHGARSAAALSAARKAFAESGDPAAFDAAVESVGDHLAAFRRMAAGAEGLEATVADLWLLHRVRGWIEEGAALLEEALAIPGLGSETRGQWQLWHSDALFQLGRIDACDEAARAVLSAVGEDPVAGGGGAAIPVALARLLMGLPRRGPGGQKATLAARAWSRISQVRFFDGDRTGFVAAMLRCVTYRSDVPIPATYAGAALVLNYTPFQRGAARMAQRAERAIGEADPFDRAWTHELLALHRLGMGELDRARHHALEGAAIFRRLRQRRNWAECQALAAYGLSFAGDIAALGVEMRALRDDGAAMRDAASELWGALGAVYADMMGDGPLAPFDAGRARTLAGEVPDPNTLLLLHGNLAWHAARTGRLAEARDERARFAAAHRGASMLSVYALHGFVGDFMALRLIAAETGGDLNGETAQALARLRAFAATFPAARPVLARARQPSPVALMPIGRDAGRLA